MPDDAVRNLIRQAKIEQVYSVMRRALARNADDGAVAADLTLRRVITSEVAFTRTTRGDQLRGLLERAGFTDF